MRTFGLILLLLLFTGLSAGDTEVFRQMKTGAEQPERYLPLIGDKNIALVANHTSLVYNHGYLEGGTPGSLADGTHLVDTLLGSGIRKEQISRIFCPEHGFRGKHAAGDHVEDGLDPVTGIPVVSLYGSNRKPTAVQMEGLDLVIFDLQDVGTRFYTYISTMHYVMEACAENGVPLLVLDRPNPNGNYVDGPVMEEQFTSFVGMHPIPVVHGCTVGELARMINGEGWLQDGARCELEVIPCEAYTHETPYSLPVSPSPNLPGDHAIRLYPSTCFFEGTVLSEGRGTPMPFEVYGHPDMEGNFEFTPVSIPGKANSPKHEGVLCRGKDLREFVPVEGWNRIHLEFLLDAYEKYPRKPEFFSEFFERLSGTMDLRWQIEAGLSEEQIRESWHPGLESYIKIREKYLIYP